MGPTHHYVEHLSKEERANTKPHISAREALVKAHSNALAAVRVPDMLRPVGEAP